MSIEELRLEALRLANHPSRSTKEIIEAAQGYFNFLTAPVANTAKPEETE